MPEQIIKINGAPIPAPAECSVQLSSLSGPGSGRTDDGVMHIDWIWRVIRKISVKLPPMNGDELGEVLAMVQGQEYDLTYLDPVKGITTTRCYTAESSADLRRGVLYGGLWVGASFNAIEMEGER